jgi:hypothetical protein
VVEAGRRPGAAVVDRLRRVPRVQAGEGVLGEPPGEVGLAEGVQVGDQVGRGVDGVDAVNRRRAGGGCGPLSAR